MNFVLNVDPNSKPIGVIDAVTVVPGVGVDDNDHADLYYMEYRYDQETGNSFLCVVYQVFAEQAA